MKVYLIYRAHPDDKAGEPPKAPVTFRVKRDQAQEIADFLNRNYNALIYMEFLATRSNEALGGGVDALMRRDTPEEKRVFIDNVGSSGVHYRVGEVEIAGDDEQKLMEELRTNKVY